MNSIENYKWFFGADLAHVAKVNCVSGKKPSLS
jgi:hypothetical protein